MLDVVEQVAQPLMRVHVPGIDGQRLLILVDRVVHVAAHLGKEARAHVRIIIQELLVDLRDGVGGGVHKLGDIGRAVGRGEIRQHAPAALLSPRSSMCVRNSCV